MGYLPCIIEVVIHKVKRDKMMVPVVTSNYHTWYPDYGEVFLSIVINGSLYKEDAFKKRGLKPEMLSGFWKKGEH